MELLDQVENKIQRTLSDLGICDKQSIIPYYPIVRDRDDISVLKCQKSGVLFLSRSDHIEIDHYEEMDGFSYWGADERKKAVLSYLEDDTRRKQQFESIITNKIWLDIGTGAGGILDQLSPLAAKTLAVEPQRAARNSLKSLGYEVFDSIASLPNEDIEVATLFHVFEHLTEPLEVLKELRQKMNWGAWIVIEVPHANDLLLTTLDFEPFKAFTFWSEHLILHTRYSLAAFLRAAGFHDISIKGFQRYPLANHLHWLATGKPGGHHEWSQLRSNPLDQAYSDVLNALDRTDTLIATARV